MGGRESERARKMTGKVSFAFEGRERTGLRGGDYRLTHWNFLRALG